MVVTTVAGCDQLSISDQGSTIGHADTGHYTVMMVSGQ